MPADIDPAASDTAPATASTVPFPDRRREERFECSEIIRWKRPGRIEDHKAYMWDRSMRGMGFFIDTQPPPRVGDLLHIRRFDNDRWDIVNEVVRVARVTETPNRALTMIGCTLESE